MLRIRLLFVRLGVMFVLLFPSLLAMGWLMAALGFDKLPSWVRYATAFVFGWLADSVISRIADRQVKKIEDYEKLNTLEKLARL